MSAAVDPAPDHHPRRAVDTSSDGRRAPALRAGAWALGTFAVVLTLALTNRLGGDMPGILLRVEAFRQGDYLRLPQWFGGAPNLTYSILLAPLGAVLGVPALAALSAASTVAGVTLLSQHSVPLRRTLAAVAAVAAAIATVCVGRITYSLGTAFGVWAVVLLVRATRRRTAAAVALALLTGAASPVAGLFLSMAAAGHLLPSRRTWTFAMVASASLAPSAVVNVLTHQDGGLDLGWTAGLAITALYAAFAMGSSSRSVRATAVLGMAATVGVTVIDTPITYIVKRLPETFGGPAAAVTGRRYVYPVLLAAVLGWNALSIRTGTTESGHGERTGTAFAPLNSALAELDPQQAVEVVPTALHWETWHVARRFPIARGWERQSDIAHGPAFYDDTPLTADEYATWLQAEQVGFVALGDLAVDHAGRAEATLLADPPPYLVEVARTDGWTIWRVDLD